MSPVTVLLDTARRAALAAGEELIARFGAPARGVQTKSTSTDMVSDADRAAERAILDVLRSERPDDDLMSEEGGAATGSTGVRWIVDPLDGTTNFLWGIPQWAVSIAAYDATGGLVAVVFDPCRDELFTARRGHGAHLWDRALRVTRPDSLSDALIGTGFNYSAQERARQAAHITRVLPRVRDIRRFGAAALDLAWLAAGRLDAFFERGLEPWDYAAGVLLVSEAGGAVRMLDPSPPRPAGVVAAHPDLLHEVHRLFEDPDG